MIVCPRAPLALVVVAALAAVGGGASLPPALAWDAEIGSAFEHFEGDYGGVETVATDRFALRLATGDAWQFRVEIPYLWTEGGDVIRVGGTTLPDGGARRGREPGSGGAGPALALPLAETGDAVVVPTTIEGLGDVEFGISHRLGGGGAAVSRLDASLDLKAPTADEDEGLGTGEWDARLGLEGEYRFWSGRGFAGAGFTRHGDPDGFDIDDVFDAFAGYETDPWARGRAVAFGWVEAQEEVVDGAGALALAGIGVRTLGRTRFVAQVAAGLDDGAADWSVHAGIAFGVATPSGARPGGWR